MAPDVTPTDPVAGQAQRAARPAGRGHTPAESHALDALSEATGRYAEAQAHDRPLHRRPSFVVAGIAATVVGVALTLAGRCEYRCAATMQLADDVSSDQYAVYRKELLDYAWDRASDSTEAHLGPRRWSVDSPGPALLRFSLTANDRQAGIQRARVIAEGYRDEMRAKAGSARAIPTEAEDILTEYVARLQTRLDETQTRVDAAVAALPDTAPSEHLESVMTRWKALRADFDTAREQLNRTTVDLTRLRSEPEPTHGIVSSGERGEARQADKALQQDLSELAVNLTELKLHLLNVWQQSAGPLERLVFSANELIETASDQPRTQEAGSDDASNVAPVAAAASAYADALGAFTQGWNHEFTSLRRLDVDPLSGEILDVYHRVQRRLNDFLFDAGKRLASLRSEVHALGADPRDTARHHVFQSNLVRAFQAMQAGHHRFEFAVDTIETPDNFRLDAAIKTARGLRRRSQERIRRIEDRLQGQAARRSRERRAGELTAAEKSVDEVRTAADRTVEALIALQDELNLTTEQSEGLYRAVLKAEIATARLELTQNDLSSTQQRLYELAARRKSGVQDVDVEIVSCEVIGGPINYGKRLPAAALGAVLTLLTVLLAQWWIIRRG